jgi:prepilin-type processing-associated H-X9-DG protein
MAVLSFAALAPVLLHARTAGPAALCMANLKSLMQAWLLYTEDYDQVVGSATYDTTAYCTQSYPASNPTTTRRVWNFVGTPQNENGQMRNDTVEDELRGIRKGALWHYLENVKPYHCPLDDRYKAPPAPPFGGSWGLKGGYRTYSIGAVYSGLMTVTSGWPTGEAYVTAYKTGEIVDPAAKLVFIEELDPYGYNANTWNMFLTTRSKWGDPFAILHGDQSIFAFADGHAAPHEWTNESTFKMASANYKEYLIPAGEKDDIDWFRWRYVPGEMPEFLKNP